MLWISSSLYKGRPHQIFTSQKGLSHLIQVFFSRIFVIMCLWSLQLEIFNTKILSKGRAYLPWWVAVDILQRIESHKTSRYGMKQWSDWLSDSCWGEITPVNCYDFIELFKYCHINNKSILVCSWVLCHNNNKWRCLYSWVSLHSSPQQSKNAKIPNMLKQPILNLETG